MQQAQRRHLLEIYQAALQGVDGRSRVYASCREMELPRAPVRVVAIGKAASAMTRGALDAWNPHIERVLLITKYGYSDPVLAMEPRIETIEAGHPYPDENSLVAGRALLDFLAVVPPQVRLLFLISGGTSSLVEVLREGITLEQLRQVNEWLLAHSFNIHQINRVRKTMSLIKGGGLCSHVHARTTDVFLISDVPDDNPADIGSGLLIPGTETSLEDLPVPGWLRDLLRPVSTGQAQSTGQEMRTQVIARNRDAMVAAAARAESLGYRVFIEDEPLQGDAVVMARKICAYLRGAEPGIHIWGGETSVQLPDRPGQGGRNQHLALAAAIEVQGTDTIALLAAGTDGSDGPGEEAGASIDGQTVARGEVEELDARACLQKADAGTFLQASADLIQTGPTGTNVMDLVIALKQ